MCPQLNGIKSRVLTTLNNGIGSDYDILVRWVGSWLVKRESQLR